MIGQRIHVTVLNINEGSLMLCASLQNSASRGSNRATSRAGPKPGQRRRVW